MKRGRTEDRAIMVLRGSVANFHFGGEIRKLNIGNSIAYRPPNFRKTKFAIEPLRPQQFAHRPSMVRQPGGRRRRPLLPLPGCSRRRRQLEALMEPAEVIGTADQ